MHTESEQKITYTKTAVVQLAFKFHIDKFEYAATDLWSEDVASKVVSSRAAWKIYLWKHSNGDVNTCIDLVGPMRDNKKAFEATYHLYLNASGGVIDSIHRGTFKFGTKGCYWKPCVEEGKISSERVKKALQVDGSLVIGADIKYLASDDSSEKAIRESDLFTKWLDSISKLHESGDYSDCTLMVGGEELKAHRLILSTISPIFGKMFSNELYQEAKDGIVRIQDPPGMLKDTSAKPYQALLSYAYTGCVDWTIFDECKRDLLIVACKYYILELKHLVEALLVNEINTESYAELALLADSYSCDQLKKACVRYLSSNSTAVMFTPQWEVLMKTRVDLACELLRLARKGKTAADGGTK